ncbi:MAG: ribonuclease HII [Candidatus Aenigmarchaeota archaeon]|nr:ribonuclease HII [Candidatus Aenigmarchaeota archaeon]
MKKILGIDEAGRGAVVGPLVIAGAMFYEKDIPKLKALEVRDSKELTPKKREYLENEIKRLALDFVVIRISANKIDELRETRNLNRIEMDYMADIIKTLRPDVAIIDSPEVNTEKIKNEILGKLKDLEVEIIAENYADKKYPVVSAASILAKVVRDRAIKSLEERLGEEIGVGYPSDERTIKFLKRVLDKYKGYPEFVRKSWTTSQRLKGEKSQKNLSNFLVKSKSGDEEKEGK